MLVFIWANCQGRGIEHYMKKSNIFNDYKFVHCHNFGVLLGEELDYESLRNCDIFIYQPLSSKHNEFSDESIIKNLKKTCIKISFPYIYNDGLFNLIKSEDFNFLDLENKYDYNYRTKGSFKYKDESVILDLKYNNIKLSDIIKLYENNKIDFNLQNRLEKSFKILEFKEKNTDVKVLDFIKKNYKKYRIFRHVNHLEGMIFEECINQIFKILKIDFQFKIDGSELYKFEINKSPHSDGINYWDIPYSKYAKKNLGFEFEISDYEDKYSNNYTKNIIKEIYFNRGLKDICTQNFLLFNELNKKEVIICPNSKKNLIKYKEYEYLVLIDEQYNCLLDETNKYQFKIIRALTNDYLKNNLDDIRSKDKYTCMYILESLNSEKILGIKDKSLYFNDKILNFYQVSNIDFYTKMLMLFDYNCIEFLNCHLSQYTEILNDDSKKMLLYFIKSNINTIKLDKKLKKIIRNNI